jgi:CDP-diglyceride synthetase
MEGLLGGLVFGTFTYVGLPWFWRFVDRYKLVPSVIAVSMKFDSIFGSSRNSNNILQDIIIGFVVSLSAIPGDLWESTLKCQYAVEDSGKLLPGHGGVLDQFDSSLVAVLVYQYCYLQQIRPSRGY